MRDIAVAIADFWKRVDKTPGHGPQGDCWVWTGACNGLGKYGRVYFMGRLEGTHRLAWKLATGKAIPSGKLICHTCDDPPCCNPDHLFLGTIKTNSEDMAAKMRAPAHLHPEKYRGELHGRAKLTNGRVRHIRRLYATGKFTKRALGKRFGVTDVLVGLIVRNKIWLHVQEVTA